MLRNDVGFPTIYHRIYRDGRRFLTLSNQTSRYFLKCIRMLTKMLSVLCFDILGTDQLIFMQRAGRVFRKKIPGPNFAGKNVQDEGKCYNTLCKKTEYKDRIEIPYP